MKATIFYSGSVDVDIEVTTTDTEGIEQELIEEAETSLTPLQFFNILEVDDVVIDEDKEIETVEEEEIGNLKLSIMEDKLKGLKTSVSEMEEKIRIEQGGVK